MRIFFVIILFSLKSFVVAQIITVGQNNLNRINDYDKAVIQLSIKLNDTMESSGSGVLLEFMDKYYIVTAAHVAKFMNKKSYFVCVDTVYSPHVFDLDKNAFVGNNKWKSHSYADIAIIEIMPKKIDKYLDFHLKKYSINLKYFERNLYFNMSRASNVICFGFVLSDLSNSNFSPESIITNFASIGPKKLKIENYIAFFYLLQLPSIQGLSGGPIFEGGQIGNSNVTYNLTRCIGIMSATYSDNTGGKISLVTPSFYLFELLK